MTVHRYIYIYMYIYIYICTYICIYIYMMYSLCMYELRSKVIVFPWSKNKQHGIAFFILGEFFFGVSIVVYCMILYL